MSFANSVFHDMLKVAKILPIHKSGSKHYMENYRPISVLLILSKVFEETIKIRITNYLETFNILNNVQFGFRKHQSISNALIALTDYHYNKFDNKEYS